MRFPTSQTGWRKGSERALSYTFFSLPKPPEEIVLAITFSLANTMRQPLPHCYFWLFFTALLQSLWVAGPARQKHICYPAYSSLPVLTSSRRWRTSFSQASCLHFWARGWWLLSLTYQGERSECSSTISNSVMSLQMWTRLLQNLSPLMLPYKILKTKSKQIKITTKSKNTTGTWLRKMEAKPDDQINAS